MGDDHRLTGIATPEEAYKEEEYLIMQAITTEHHEASKGSKKKLNVLESCTVNSSTASKCCAIAKKPLWLGSGLPAKFTAEESTAGCRAVLGEISNHNQPPPFSPHKPYSIPSPPSDSNVVTIWDILYPSSDKDAIHSLS